jgi:hypothetical protein
MMTNMATFSIKQKFFNMGGGFYSPGAHSGIGYATQDVQQWFRQQKYHNWTYSYICIPGPAGNIFGATVTQRTVDIPDDGIAACFKLTFGHMIGK